MPLPILNLVNGCICKNRVCFLLQVTLDFILLCRWENESITFSFSSRKYFNIFSRLWYIKFVTSQGIGFCFKPFLNMREIETRTLLKKLICWLWSAYLNPGTLGQKKPLFLEMRVTRKILTQAAANLFFKSIF